MIRQPKLACLLLLLATTSTVTAGDPKLYWPQFLGPQRDGIIRDTGLNVDWKAKPPATVWKVPIGNGFSSMCIVGDRIYTMAKRDKEDGIVCFDRTDGKEIWYYPVAPSYLDKQKWGAGPRATPTYHQGKLYCLFPMGEFLCVTPDGKKLWEANLFKDTGAENKALKEIRYWGISGSPLVVGDLVIVVPGGTKGNSVAAYHKDTGKLMWMVGDDFAGYASPILINVAGKEQVAILTGESVLGLDPVKGAILWRYGFGNQFNATCASPIWVDNNCLFISAAYGAGSVLVEIMPPGKDDAKWAVREKWKNKKDLQSLMATSMVVNGHVYGISGDLAAIFMRCLDLKTGEVKWEQRMDGRHSLIAMEGHLICTGERGTLKLLEATPRAYEVKAELPKLLTGSRCWTMPAYADGKLFRDAGNLHCLDVRK